MDAMAKPAPQAGAAPPKMEPASLSAPSEARHARWAQAFSSIVAVMMKDEAYKAVRLAELEHMVVPAVVSGKWRVGHAPLRANGDGQNTSGQPDARVMAPAAAVLWAQVSDDIDRRLSSSNDKGILILPDKWISGPHVWITMAAGEKHAIARVIAQLRQTDFKDKVVKMRTRGADGTLVVRTLGEAIQ